MLSLRATGINSAWMAEFGYVCTHCDRIHQADPFRIAKVSFSLVQMAPEGALPRQTLVAMGMGVTRSLLVFERRGDVQAVHEIVITRHGMILPLDEPWPN